MKLNDGMILPDIGFGTYTCRGIEGISVIKNAIELGYRLLDSAVNYENEGAVGKAVNESSVKREDLFITSKLPGRHHNYKDALITIEESLFRAGLDYYDLYLIHWPNPSKDLYVEAWQAMIEAKKRGYIRSIGVCNFLPEHTERLISETGVKPSVNQIELHPYFNQEEQRKYDMSKEIVIESWSPLGRGNSMLTHPVLHEIAREYHRSISQIILRWHVQLGVIPIPKAASKQHQEENLNIFDFKLSDQEMKRINELTMPDGRTTNQDPKVYEEF